MKYICLIIVALCLVNLLAPCDPTPHAHLVSYQYECQGMIGSGWLEIDTKSELISRDDLNQASQRAADSINKKFPSDKVTEDQVVILSVSPMKKDTK